MRHAYQGIPLEGYASLMRSILSGIPVMLSCDYLTMPRLFAGTEMPSVYWTNR